MISWVLLLFSDKNERLLIDMPMTCQGSKAGMRLVTQNDDSVPLKAASEALTAHRTFACETMKHACRCIVTCSHDR